MKNKNLAAIFAIFMGWLGIHRFYLGQVGLGIFYLLLSFVFSLMPFVFVISVIDAIVLYMMDQNAFDRKYNKKQRRDHYIHSKKERRAYKRQRRSANHPRARRQEKQYTGNIRKFHHFVKQAKAKMRDYDYEEAIEAYNEALKVKPNDKNAHFELAGLYSVTEDIEHAMDHLRKAVELGFRDFEKIKNHENLAFLRIHKVYEEFEENGFNVGPRKIPVQSPAKSKPTTTAGLLDQLNALEERRKKGLLTEEQFLVEKKKLLD